MSKQENASNEGSKESIPVKKLLTNVLLQKNKRFSKLSPDKMFCQIYFDQNDINLKNFYWSISTKTKLDQFKLMHELKLHFKEQADNIWPFIKKIFAHFKHGITFKEYC